MLHPDLAFVTGAFSYTGRYVTRRLLDQGARVRTLMRTPASGGHLCQPCRDGPFGLFRPRWAAQVDAGRGSLL